MYSSSLVEGAWKYVYALNPMSTVLDGFRWSIADGPAPGPEALVSPRSSSSSSSPASPTSRAPSARSRTWSSGDADSDRGREPLQALPPRPEPRRVHDAARDARREATRRAPRTTRYLWALRDVSFSVPKDQALGLIGPNGAGKTTLLKVLARITQPTHGCVAHARPRRGAPRRRHRLPSRADGAGRTST